MNFDFITINPQPVQTTSSVIKEFNQSEKEYNSKVKFLEKIMANEKSLVTKSIGGSWCVGLAVFGLSGQVLSLCGQACAKYGSSGEASPNNMSPSNSSTNIATTEQISSSNLTTATSASRRTWLKTAATRVSRLLFSPRLIFGLNVILLIIGLTLMFVL